MIWFKNIGRAEAAAFDDEASLRLNHRQATMKF
jgi:hypothetical protein